MVSFSCEQCCEVMKKPKLDAHAQRCWGAQFTCIDCNTTFEGTAYRAHTSCVSEEQRYHKSVYKAPKGKGKNQQQQQQQQQNNKPAAPAAPEASTLAAAATAGGGSKRAREEEEDGGVAPESASKPETNGGLEGEPDQKKKKKEKKKDKKKKNKDKKEEAAAPAEANGTDGDAAATAAAPTQPHASEGSRPSVPEFLASVVEPLLKPSTGGATASGGEGKGEEVSLAQVRRAVLAAAGEQGYDAREVEESLWQGLKLAGGNGGKKAKVRVEFS
ncbi:hypothetical protein JCM3774_002950 [Rhodotorula dairenensis]